MRYLLESGNCDSDLVMLMAKAEMSASNFIFSLSDEAWSRKIVPAITGSTKNPHVMAWQGDLGSKMSVLDYTAKMLSLSQSIDHCCQLEIISWHGDPTKKLEALKYMQVRVGSQPVALFVEGEPIPLLFEMLHVVKKVALLPVRRKDESARDRHERIDHWLQWCFDAIADQKGKAHLMDADDLKIIRKYPFDSFSSSLWWDAAKYGRVLMPKDASLLIGGKPARYREHFDNLTDAAQKVVKDWLMANGATVEMAKNSASVRALLSARYIFEQAQYMSPPSFQRQQAEMFTSEGKPSVGKNIPAPADEIQPQEEEVQDLPF